MEITYNEISRERAQTLEAEFDNSLQSLQDGVKQKVLRVLSVKTPQEVQKYKVEFAVKAWIQKKPIHKLISLQVSGFDIIHDFFTTQEKNSIFGDNPFFFSRDCVGEGQNRGDYFSRRIEFFENILFRYKKSNKIQKEHIRGQYPIDSLFMHSNQMPGKYKYEHNDSYNSIMAQLRKGGYHEVFESSEGAENTNRFFLHGEVLKTSKPQRHGDDYFSLLQLMIMMLKVERDFNTKLEVPGVKQQVEIKTATKSFGITKHTETGEYYRDIIQEFAEGTELDIALKTAYNEAFPNEKIPLGWSKKHQITISQFQKGCSANIPLFLAYKNFLEHVRSKGQNDGYILDITDSRLGAGTDRGNVLSTSNIFVKQDGDNITFTVIDPDVFNTDGNYKFSPVEKYNSHRYTGNTWERFKKGLKAAGNTVILNVAREVVKKDMESHIAEILDGEDTTISRRRYVNRVKRIISKT